MLAFLVVSLSALLIGLAGSLLIGVPAHRIVRSEWQQCTQPRRDVLRVLCRTSAIATTLSIALWSLPQFQVWSPIAAPSPEEALIMLRAWIVLGLTPGLSLLSAGLTSLCCRRL